MNKELKEFKQQLSDVFDELIKYIEGQEKVDQMLDDAEKLNEKISDPKERGRNKKCIDMLKKRDRLDK